MTSYGPIGAASDTTIIAFTPTAVDRALLGIVGEVTSMTSVGASGTPTDAIDFGQHGGAGAYRERDGLAFIARSTTRSPSQLAARNRDHRQRQRRISELPENRRRKFAYLDIVPAADPTAELRITDQDHIYATKFITIDSTYPIRIAMILVPPLPTRNHARQRLHLRRRRHPPGLIRLTQRTS